MFCHVWIKQKSIDVKDNYVLSYQIRQACCPPEMWEKTGRPGEKSHKHKENTRYQNDRNISWHQLTALKHSSNYLQTTCFSGNKIDQLIPYKKNLHNSNTNHVCDCRWNDKAFPVSQPRLRLPNGCWDVICPWLFLLPWKANTRIPAFREYVVI